MPNRRLKWTRRERASLLSCVGEPLKRSVLALQSCSASILQMELDADKLANYMSELSERAYSAAWMEGLEYALWNAVLRGRVKYGRLQITRAHTLKLQELSDRCGGWIVWDDERGEAFVPLDQWLKKYKAAADSQA